MKSKSSCALSMAHILHKNKPGFRWSDILRYAWYFVRLRKWMQNGVVTFTYYKKEDDSLREAKGTLHPLLIPAEDTPKGALPRRPNYANFTYFDLERKAWRSFDIRNFVGVVTIYELKQILYAKEKE